MRLWQTGDPLFLCKVISDEKWLNVLTFEIDPLWNWRFFSFSPNFCFTFRHGSNHSCWTTIFPLRWTSHLWWIKTKLSVTWPLLTNHLALSTCPDQSHGYACCCCCPSVPPPPLSLPGMWKANEESWAEGSFCVLVKKNNLCQRKVLQQLCCRTCSLKGWWEVPQGAGGGHPSTQAHSLSHIIYKKICAS